MGGFFAPFFFCTFPLIKYCQQFFSQQFLRVQFSMNQCGSVSLHQGHLIGSMTKPPPQAETYDRKYLNLKAAVHTYLSENI